MILQVERKTTTQQMAFGAAVGVLLFVVAWIAFYVLFVNSLRLPITPGEFAHGSIIAPNDLVDKKDVLLVVVDRVSCCKSQPELRLVLRTDDEQWLITLVYRAHGKDVRTVMWRFVSAYNRNTGGRVPLTSVATLAIVRDYSDKAFRFPLAFMVVPSRIDPTERVYGPRLACS